jgi:hypothetical protein
MVRYTCCKCKYVCRYEGKTIGDCTDQTSADGWEPTGKMTERVCKGCRSLGKCLTAVYKNEPVAEGLNKICANVWGALVIEELPIARMICSLEFYAKLHQHWKEYVSRQCMSLLMV